MGYFAKKPRRFRILKIDRGGWWWLISSQAGRLSPLCMAMICGAGGEVHENGNILGSLEAQALPLSCHAHPGNTRYLLVDIFMFTDVRRIQLQLPDINGMSLVTGRQATNDVLME